ncbi:MAG TPA: TonB-dependent receptor [Bacteroidia bacterium]|nr:TonB-dependent receptor [Bacteroidia bacterium]
MRKIALFTLLLLSVSFLQAQHIIQGKVYDKETKEALQGASVLIRGSQSGTITDKSGYFKINVSDNRQVVLLVSFLGFKTQEIKAEPDGKELQVYLESSALVGDEVVISASRVNEKVISAPASIQKIQATTIQNLPGWNFYHSLGNIKEVDIVTNNLGFATFNTRGFNSTQPYRVVQYVDGMDNQSSGLNFSPGNMFGVSDIDLASIELISGPASAMYGPNALQGVLSMTTKNPYDYKGLTVMLKGGSRNYMEGQLRFADTYGKKDQIGFKLTAGYFSGDDWPADDPKYNRYKIMPSSPQNIYNLIADSGFQNYVSVYDSARPAPVSFMLPGYMEGDMVSLKNESMKVNAFLAYRFNGHAEISYNYKFSQSSGVFQGNNRARMEDFIHQQHKIEGRYRNFTFKAYATFENSNKSFDLGLTGINLGMAGLPAVSRAYADAFVSSIEQQTNYYSLPFNYAQMYPVAHQAAMAASANGWLQPGTDKFNAVLNSIITNPDRPQGSRYPDLSIFEHAEAGYSKDLKWAELNAGLIFRNWIPRTNGKIFSDTNGVNISFFDFGGFAQLTKNLLNDNLKLIASVRADKSKNYNAQLSPRFAVVYKLKSHYFRVGLQSAFRSPTLNDQYYLLNTGSFIVKGNITGYYNLYTLSSVMAFKQTGNPALLETIQLDPIQPEQVKTFEIGYRSQIINKLYIDWNFYMNKYNGFIGSVRAVEPKTGIAGDSTGLSDLKNGKYNTYSIYANSKSDVQTLGSSIGLNYAINNKINVYFNYTYAKMKDLATTDPLVPGFNTPKHRFNIGLEGKNLFKNFGLTANFRWVDSVKWEAVFASGTLQPYSTFDVQVNYHLVKYNTIIRIGGTNLLGREYYQAFGAPGIGRFLFASLTYNFTDL